MKTYPSYFTKGDLAGRVNFDHFDDMDNETLIDRFISLSLLEDGKNIDRTDLLSLSNVNIILGQRGLFLKAKIMYSFERAKKDRELNDGRGFTEEEKQEWFKINSWEDDN